MPVKPSPLLQPFPGWCRTVRWVLRPCGALSSSQPSEAALPCFSLSHECGLRVCICHCWFSPLPDCILGCMYAPRFVVAVARGCLGLFYQILLEGRGFLEYFKIRYPIITLLRSLIFLFLQFSLVIIKCSHSWEVRSSESLLDLHHFLALYFLKSLKLFELRFPSQYNDRNNTCTAFPIELNYFVWFTFMKILWKCEILRNICISRIFLNEHQVQQQPCLRSTDNVLHEHCRGEGSM